MHVYFILYLTATYGAATSASGHNAAESECGLQDYVRVFQEAGGVGAVTAAAPADGGSGRDDEYRMMVVVLASVLGSLLLAIAIAVAVAVRQWRRVTNPIISVRPPTPTLRSLSNPHTMLWTRKSTQTTTAPAPVLAGGLVWLWPCTCPGHCPRLCLILIQHVHPRYVLRPQVPPSADLGEPPVVPLGCTPCLL